MKVELLVTPAAGNGSVKEPTVAESCRLYRLDPPLSAKVILPHSPGHRSTMPLRYPVGRARMVTSIVVVEAHCPVFGVKVKVNVPGVDVLIVAGFHVPEIPLVDVVGNTGAVLFWQISAIGLNKGVAGATI